MIRVCAPLLLLVAASCAGMAPAEGDAAPASSAAVVRPSPVESPAWVRAADRAGAPGAAPVAAVETRPAAPAVAAAAAPVQEPEEGAAQEGESAEGQEPTGLGTPPPSGVQEPAPRGELTDAQRNELVLRTGYGEMFSLHKLNYAALGPNDLKQQLSFKYRFVRDAPAYIAFTNIIGWDIYENSFPIRDIIFNPEMFYRFRVDSPITFYMDAGYWHSSNGQDGPESRNWDRLMVRGIFSGKLWNRPFAFTPAGYITLADSRQNPDIEDFLGVWDAGFILQDLISPDQPGNDLDFLLNVTGGKGNMTAALQYRLEEYKWQPNLYMHVFTGYGDTMLEYNERKTEIRFGVSFYY